MKRSCPVPGCKYNISSSPSLVYEDFYSADSPYKRCKMTNKMNEFELVERVFLKIVLAESDDQLYSALNGFLAPVLLKLSTSNEQVKDKVLELLTHINRRLKSRTCIGLPVESLINQYKDEKVPVNVKNFTIIYIKMGFQRADEATQIKLIPKMFSCLKGRPTGHQNTLILNILYHLNKLEYPESIEEKRKIFSFLNDKQITQFVLHFFQDFLLLPYNLNLDMNNVPPPPGLSKVSFSRLHTEPLMTEEQVEHGKLAILKFLSSDLLPASDIIGHFITATSDVKYSISSKGEHGVKAYASADLWEDRNVVNKLLKLYQGSQVNHGNLTQTISSDKVRLPSSIRLKLKIFPYFLKSKIIVDINPAMCLQVIFEGLFGENSNLKIKYFALELIHHISLYGSEKTFSFMVPLFNQAICRVSLDKKENGKLRSLAFAGFSKIARRAPAVFRKDISLIQKLLVLVEEEVGDVRMSVQNAISSIAPCFAGITGMDMKVMETLVSNHMESDSPQVRLAVVQLASLAFSSTHIPSRYALVLMSGDSKDDIRDEAVRSLSPKDTEKSYPDYTELVNYFYEKIIGVKAKKNTDVFVLSAPVVTRMLTFLSKCLCEKSEISHKEEVTANDLFKLKTFFESMLKDCTSPEHLIKTSVGQHLTLLKYTLHPSADYTVYSHALKHILPIIAAIPFQLAPLLSDSLSMINTLLHSSKEEIRDYAAQCLSITTCSLPSNQILSILKKQLDDLSENKSKMKFEEIHGQILCIGYTTSRFSHFNNQPHVEDMEVDSVQYNIKDLLKQLLGFCVDQLKGSNIALSCSCCVAIAEVSRCYVLPLPDSSKDELCKEELVHQLATVLKDAPETKLKEKAVLALSSLCIGDFGFVHREKIVQAFVDASKVRHMEVQFTIGEGFSCVGAGKQSKFSKAKWLVGNSAKLEGDLMESDGDNNKDFMTSLIKRIIKECVYSSIAYVRQAGTIWLLCIVKYSGFHPSVQRNIKDVQGAFVNMLSDSDEITQDVASRGLGLVYDHVKLENKQEVVSILMDRLTSGKRPKQNVDDNTKVFEPGELGQSPDGGNLSTYKELCSLATSLNKPDLMYKFMSLANHQAVWNSRKGAAFGFLSIAALVGDELKPYLSEIIPKLYRYQYDPNIGVRRAMTNIWSVIAPDGKKTVDKYTKEIAQDLLSNITSNTWRTRESTCLGLCDLIKTCPAEEIISYLPSIWEVVFKVLDDIKESVRKAATSLAKALSKLSIRLCDKNHSKLGEKAITEVLPILLDVGLASRVAEVKTLSLETLVQISKSAGELLKPHIPIFVIALLESLSGLEPQHLNTLSLQLSQSKEAQDKLDLIRVSASKTSPMMEAVNFCVLHVDNSVLPELIPRICELLKTGLGVGTKVGCSTFVISLTLQCKEELTPFSGKLLSALLNGLTGHNNSIKKSYAAAIGHLIRFSKDSSVEKLLSKITKWYFEKEDESLHISCATCVSAMARYSPDKFYQFNSTALPLVFLAMQGEKEGHTENENDRMWTEIWNNNTSGNISAIKLYLSDIHSMIEPLLTSQSWGLREKAAKAILCIADTLGSSLQQPHLGKFVRLLLDVIPGRTWNGKESLVRALSKICIKCRDVMSNQVEDDFPAIQEISTILIKECRKENMEYKLCAIQCFTEVAEEWKYDAMEEFRPILNSLLQPEDEDVDVDDDEDIVRKNKIRAENMTCAACDAFGRLWPHELTSQERHFEYMKQTVIGCLTNSTWKTQLAILKAAIKIVERTNWNEACTNWKTPEGCLQADTFLQQLIPIVCSCIEVTSYSSVRLHAVKVLKTFFSFKKDISDLSSLLAKHEEMILSLTKKLDDKGNFELSTNVAHLTASMKS